MTTPAAPARSTTPDYARRMVRAAEEARAAGLDGLLVTPGPDLTYFTGYTPTVIAERITLLAIGVSREPAMLVPTLERDGAEGAAAAAAVTLIDWSDGEDPYQAAARLLGTGGCYAISDSAWAMHVLGLQRTLPRTSYVSMTDALPLLRAVKDDDELARLAAAGAAVDACFEAILRVRFEGRRESDIAADVAALLRDNGHARVDFTVVGSGPNGANPHHDVSDRVIERGDFVVLDFGGIKDGYASDITRTVHVGGPDEEEREVYEVVRRAQQAGFEAVRPGAACQDIDRAARAVIDDAAYGEYFIHRTGHGIGLTVHEPPYMVEGETQPLKPGMCFSVEPGVYLPGRFGVRVEDIVTVTDDGGLRLNDATRGLQIVS